MPDNSLPAHSATQQATKGLDELYEFDREPVSQDKLLGLSHFLGSFAGEHVAATEFVIGVMFVNWGAGLWDIFVGLAIGNLLATLTWMLLCAPIAVETRLTLYWYLRRIGGPGLTLLYNVLNALLFCVLGGCMITVSASAVRIPFGIPAQVNWYPDDLRFVGIVLLVGAVVVTLATLGFEKLASFATVCSPWMFLMFIVGAIAMFPALYQKSGASSFADMAGSVVWTGKTPDGSAPMGFWRVAVFAWICNFAMNAGLSDMALFRYAKKASYGAAAAVGMFLGHYLAWICAGLMGAGAALLLEVPLASLDAGAVAYQALGVCGILAVVLAGWTTSNPTLYRAGLALQAITPNWSRVKVTIITGIITTMIACFPFVFTRLLDFVGFYGMLLAPAGAIVVAEHWIFPKLGWTRYWASYEKRWINLPALAAWGISVGVALVIERSGLIHLFYLAVLVYLLTLVLYLAFAAGSGARKKFAGALEEPVAHATKPNGEPKTNPPSRSMLLLFGGAAGLALVVSFVYGVRVSTAPMADYPAMLAALQSDLIIPAMVYFLAGTRFYQLWQRS